jgi:hypothetical protein
MTDPLVALREALEAIIGEALEVTEYQHGNPHSVLDAIVARARAALDSIEEGSHELRPT